MLNKAVVCNLQNTSPTTRDSCQCPILQTQIDKNLLREIITNNNCESIEFSFHNYEISKEVQKILRALTAQLSPYSSLLLSYAQIIGSFDFIRAKALLAIDMNANRPMVNNKAITHLIEAYHPLLYIYNKTSGKKTIPVNLELDDEARILIISGPNAGGKTVSMKTLGLNQVMLQSGLLVPMSATSQMGIYKQLFIQIF